MEKLLQKINTYAKPLVKNINIKGEIAKDILYAGVMIGIIGSRRCTYYGKQVVEKIARDLSGYNAIIISGLMYGIDLEAHKSALKYKIPTIGVLGYGIDYPKIRKDIRNVQTEIINSKGGLIISEFENNYPPSVWTFPKRNRIVASLSDILIIVESTEKSGCFITLDIAIDMGKEIYAVPGSIFSPASVGNNKLISDGIGVYINTDSLNIDKYKVSQNVTSNEMFQFSKNHQLLYNTIQKYPDGIEVDTIANVLKYEPSQINILLTDLEISGIIMKDIAQKYHIKSQ